MYPQLDDAPKRTAAVAALAQLRSTLFSGWRDELYPLGAGLGRAAVAGVERAAAAAKIIKAWRVHVNGFVRKVSGLHLWIARRSSQSQRISKLDHIAAGGQVRCSASASIASSAMCCY
jgi:hypothetical protein